MNHILKKNVHNLVLGNRNANRDRLWHIGNRSHDRLRIGIGGGNSVTRV